MYSMVTIVNNTVLYIWKLLSRSFLFFKLKKIILFYFFGCIGSLLRHAGFSLVAACGFSSCGVWAPGSMGSVVCGTWALSLRCKSSVVVAPGLSCPTACGILVPRPGIEPASPELEGRFFTTGPPGKSLCRSFKIFLINLFNWMIVDLQCHVHFRCTEQWFSYTYIHTYIHVPFQILFPYSLLQNIEYSSLCYTVGPCWLSILYIVVCIC